MPRSQSARAVLICFVTLLALCMAGSARGEPASPNEAELPHLSFVPFTANGILPRSIVGVEMTAARLDRGLESVAQLGPAWIRINGLLWKDVESIEGRGYVWTRPNTAALEAELRAINERGLQPILVVRGYPRWAAPTDCAPINPQKYAQFAAFVVAAVKRYSAPPYNVRYWELGNEPDAPTGADSMYGCWGNPSDPYYGGRTYGNMLKAVYPAVKEANAQVQLLNGSLLLDRPTTPSAKFMDGVFVAGAGHAFDVLGFHTYCMFDSKNPDGHDALFDSCADDWKVGFLRDMTRKYGFSSKPLLRTETALLCSVGHQACRQQQADFIGRLFARSLRDGLLGSIWYIFDSDGFRNAALVEPYDPETVRPAYLALKQAATKFGEARYLGYISGQPSGVEGYRFGDADRTIAIVWSNTRQTVRISMPPEATPACSGRDGQTLFCSNVDGSVTLTVGTSPVYVVWR